MRYFAYGSNMFLPKLHAVTPSAVFYATGFLSGHVLRFNKRSTDGSGKANIIPTGNNDDRVWGVIFVIDDEEGDDLTASEVGYAPVEVQVHTANGPLSVRTYTSLRQNVDNSLNPYTWYKEYVLRGARFYKIDEEYVRVSILPIDATNDQNADRANERLLILTKIEET